MKALPTNQRARRTHVNKSTRTALPKSLTEAAGMLKGKVPSGVKYQQAMRREWTKRLNKIAESRPSSKKKKK